MVNGRLSTAEQRIDLRARTELFRGREIEVVTGRVLLHALDEQGQPLCGHDRAELTPINRPWSAEYLPHLLRCPDCAAQVTDAPAPDHGPAAGGVEIRTAQDTERENAGRAALQEILDRYDLRRWMFTDLITVDETIRGGVSHPLTLSPVLLVRRPAMTLTSFLHEQLHWVDGPGADSAHAEASERWPNPPPFSAGGAADANSTWLHLTVCALEYQSLSEILGTAAAAAELRQHTGYAWIYGQILADPDWFAEFLHRHGLRVPEQPPVPRRCFTQLL